MDSHQFSQYCMIGRDVVFPSYSSIPSSIPTGISGSLKSELRNSPNSPFSSPFDTEMITTLNESQDQHNFIDNCLGCSPQFNSTLGFKRLFHQSMPNVSCQQENFLLYPGGVSLSPMQSATHGQNINHALEELETALMGDDEEETSMGYPYVGDIKVKGMQQLNHMSRSWGQISQVSHASVPKKLKTEVSSSAEEPFQGIAEGFLQYIPHGNLQELLIACARSLSENKINYFEKLIEKARYEVSVTGSPIQRLGGYVVEGLIARKEASGTNICRGLRCKEPKGRDLLSYMRILYELCPYLKFGYMAANGAIADACRNEDRIHIIDFQIAQGTQWMTLLQALAARPGGPPHVRITGIDDPVSKYARGDTLEAIGKKLAAVSKQFDIPIEFYATPVFAPALTRDMLDLRPGEALAVNFPLQLHLTPDESVDVSNPRDGLLRMVKSLSPKVVTLVEQESNTNTTPFLHRFVETLDYYTAIFESIDVAMARDKKERINVEQHCLAREIVNIIACEGKERVERHELFGKWKSRLTMAGFQQYPLSRYVNCVIEALLKCYSKHYTLEEKDGSMLLGWKERKLISASAWC